MTESAEQSFLIESNQQLPIEASSNIVVPEVTQQIVSRTYRTNGLGELIDIDFTHNGYRIPLKTLLPGEYTLEVTFPQYQDIAHDEHHYHDIVKNQVHITDYGTEYVNGIILHEAGHGVDNKQHEHIYIPKEEELFLSALKSRIIMGLLNEYQYGGNNYADSIYDVFHDIDSNDLNLSVQEINKLKGEISIFMLVIEESDEEKLQLQLDEVFEQKRILMRKIDTMKEVNANILALQAYKKAKEEGVLFFGGSDKRALEYYSNQLARKEKLKEYQGYKEGEPRFEFPPEIVQAFSTE